MSDTQIIVPESAAGEQAASAIRDLLKIAGTALVAHGAVSASVVEPLIGAIMTLVPVICSQYVVWRKNQKMRTMANAVPDSVAQVR